MSRAAVVARPAAEVVGEPGGEVDRAEVGPVASASARARNSSDSTISRSRTASPWTSSRARRYSSAERSRRRATSTWPIRAVSGVRSWCEASPVNRVCRSIASWRRSSRPLNESREPFQLVAGAGAGQVVAAVGDGHGPRGRRPSRRPAGGPGGSSSGRRRPRGARGPSRARSGSAPRSAGSPRPARAARRPPAGGPNPPGRGRTGREAGGTSSSSVSSLGLGSGRSRRSASRQRRPSWPA